MATKQTFTNGDRSDATKITTNFEGAYTGEFDYYYNDLRQYRSTSLDGVVLGGLVITTPSALLINYSQGYVLVNGYYLLLAGGSTSVNATKDTYFDVADSGDHITGTLTKVEVANGATSGMTLTANSVRIGKVISGASVSTINQACDFANSWSGFDVLGNPVYRAIGSKIVGRGLRTTNVSLATSGITAWTPMTNIPFICRANTGYSLTIHESLINGHAGTGKSTFTFYISSTALAYTTVINNDGFSMHATANMGSWNTEFTFSSLANTGYRFIDIKETAVTWTGSLTANASTTTPAIYEIREL